MLEERLLKMIYGVACDKHSRAINEALQLARLAGEYTGRIAEISTTQSHIGDAHLMLGEWEETLRRRRAEMATGLQNASKLLEEAKGDASYWGDCLAKILGGGEIGDPERLSAALVDRFAGVRDRWCAAVVEAGKVMGEVQGWIDSERVPPPGLLRRRDEAVAAREQLWGEMEEWRSLLEAIDADSAGWFIIEGEVGR